MTVAAREDQTTTIMFNDADPDVEICTANRRWINRMEQLVEQGHAEELEPTEKGHRDFAMSKKLIRIPFYRKPREWTEEQREAARERIAGVREAVAAQRAAEQEEEETPEPEASPKRRMKKKAVAPPIEEEEEEEDEEEVVTRKPRSRKRRTAS